MVRKLPENRSIHRKRNKFPQKRCVSGEFFQYFAEAPSDQRIRRASM